SYKVWEEGGIFPQVVFEVWSPNNTAERMEEKRQFYEKYKTEEYYIVYPDFPAHLDGWLYCGNAFVKIEEMNGYISPRLGFRFSLAKGQLAVFGPDGRRLRKPDEIAQELGTERERAEQEHKRANEATAERDAERRRAEEAHARESQATAERD